jgi:hypothetical protein
MTGKATASTCLWKALLPIKRPSHDVDSAMHEPPMIASPA